MPTNLGPKRRVDLGPTGHMVRANIQRIRKSQRLTHADVVQRMASHGYSMPRTALSEIESGGRRVSVDDLMALAVSLGVNPDALLFPPVYGEDRHQITGLAADAESHFLWSWAEGLLPLLNWDEEGTAAAVFRQYARPTGYPPVVGVDETNVETLENLAREMRATVEDMKAQAERLIQQTRDEAVQTDVAGLLFRRPDGND